MYCSAFTLNLTCILSLSHPNPPKKLISTLVKLQIFFDFHGIHVNVSWHNGLLLNHRFKTNVYHAVHLAYSLASTNG